MDSYCLLNGNFHPFKLFGCLCSGNTDFTGKFWVPLLRNEVFRELFQMSFFKLGAFAPEWVLLLRNKVAFWGDFAPFLTLLGAFAPEIYSVSKPSKWVHLLRCMQISKSISINDNKISTSLSEKIDFLVPAAKIADMATGWLAGQAARDFTPTDASMMSNFDIENSDEFKTTKYFCKTNFDMKAIKKEESKYVDLPKIYKFHSQRDKEIILNRNFKRVNAEVAQLIDEVFPGRNSD